jgi:hypothetical protein
MKRCNRAWLFCVAAVAAVASFAQERVIPEAPPVGRSDSPPAVAASGAARPQRAGEAGAPGVSRLDRTQRLLRILDDPETKQAINLTDEQKEGLNKRIDALNERQAVVDDAIRIAAQNQIARAAKVMADKQATTNELMALVEKIGALRTEQAKIQTEKLLAIRDMLSAEQIRGANEVLQKRTEKIRERLTKPRVAAEARGAAGARGARTGGNSKGAATPPQRPEGWDE